MENAKDHFARLVNVSRETIEALDAYEALLRKWQKGINLVSASSLDDIWTRHFLDSAQLVALVPETASIWLDLGSGAGFPGLVAGLMLKDRPGFQLHLVESDQRKCIFLGEAVRLLSIPAIIHTRRIEAFQLPSSPHVISARALASLGEIFRLSAGFWGKDTLGLFLKGNGLPGELTEAGKDWIFEKEVIASLSDPSGHVLKIWGLQNASA